MRKVRTIVNKVKMVLPFCLFTFLPLTASAQDFKVVRGDCMPDITDSETAEARPGMPRKKLPTIITNWDADRIYRQLVILVEFEGDNTYFHIDAPHDTYNKMFNEEGYNQRGGKGCVAEYYREQSNGLFNLQFDVFGPYRVGAKAQPYSNPNSDTRNYGREAMIEATQMMLAENPDLDYTVYDWNNDGKINQVIYVCAGYAGNVSNEIVYGYLWPNTSSFSSITTPDGKKISNYTASAEHWPTASKASCGIGTICHEFTHSLGLPDIYPTSPSAGYSVVDEWDLMDGGNFTNYGWCPPNYTPLEKMLLGWQTPVELTEATTITDLKPASEGGEIYIVKHTNNEYLLLENRQWSGWDAGLPGKGLVIWHVNYNKSSWSNNAVNNTKGKYNFCLFAADNMNYDQWDKYISNNNLSQYQNSTRMNSRYLSGTPYPLMQEDLPLNDSLTDVSVPAAIMYNANGEGSTMLGKSISNIRMTDDGLVSFDFMGGEPTGISEMEDGRLKTEDGRLAIYDLQGRRVDAVANTQHPTSNTQHPTPNTQLKRGLYIINGKKIVK